MAQHLVLIWQFINRARLITEQLLFGSASFLSFAIFYLSKEGAIHPVIIDNANSDLLATESNWIVLMQIFPLLDHCFCSMLVCFFPFLIWSPFLSRPVVLFSSDELDFTCVCRSRAFSITLFTYFFVSNFYSAPIIYSPLSTAECINCQYTVACSWRCQ